MRSATKAALPLLLTLVAGRASAHSPHDHIDAFAISPNYAVDRTIFVASAGSVNVFLVSRDGGLTWSEARNGLRGRTTRVIRMVSDYGTSGELYAATSAGVQVSMDGGASWQRTIGQHGLIWDLDCSPVQPGGARNMALFYCRGANLWRSDDHGQTESLLSLPANGATVQSIAVSPTYWVDSTVVLTMSDGRVLVSGDSGGTWTSSTLPALGTHVSLSSDYANDQRMWVSTWGAGVVESVDGGATFGASGSGLTDLLVNQTDIVPSQTPSVNPSVIYASTRADGVFRSTDGGATWTRTGLNITLSHQSSNHFTSIQASPDWHTDSTVMCGAFEGLHASSNDGTSWIQYSIIQTHSGRLVGVSPTYAVDRTAFAVGYGMPLNKSTSGGDYWAYGWNGVVSNSIYALGPSPEFATDQMMLASGGALIGFGASMHRSLDGGQTFQLLLLPAHPLQCDPFGNQSGYEIRSIAYSPTFATDRVVFGISAMGVVYRSNDAGATWAYTAPPLSQNCWMNKIQCSPNFATDNTVFATGTGVYRSNDGGATFTQTTSSGFVGLQIPPDYATVDEIYTFTWHGQFAYLTQGATQPVYSNNGLDGHSITGLQMSPNITVDNTIYASTAGGGLFESTNRGRSWQRVSVPDGFTDHIISLAISPDFVNDQTLFAGVYAGHARSTDAGRTWELVTEFEVYDEGRDPWEQTGTWQRTYDPDAIKIEVRETTQVGATMSLPFVGHKVRLFGSVGPDHGIVEVRVDGQLLATVDTYRSMSSAHELWFEHRMPLDRHVIELTVTGQQNPLATGNTIAVDGAEVHYSTRGSYLEIGAGCVSSTGFVPENLTSNGPPRYGQTVQFEVSNAPANQALAVLTLGVTNSGGLDLSLLGATGCVLYPDTLVNLPVPTNGSGVGSIALPLTNDPLLLGLEIFTQPIVVDPGQNVLGIVVGTARRGLIGAP